MNRFASLHEESLYLRGAKAVVLRLTDNLDGITIEKGKDGNVYNKAIIDEILHNRESLIKFLLGYGWQYYDHRRDKKNKLTSVKVKFNE